MAASCVDVHLVAEYSPRFIAPSRLRVTAAYDWTARDVLESDHPLLEEVDDVDPKLPAGSSLLSPWMRWHLRAETLFAHGTHFGFCSLLRKAERVRLHLFAQLLLLHLIGTMSQSASDV